MKFIVYHAKSLPLDLLTNAPPFPEFNLENYVKVAEVDTTDLDEVFRLTNNLDSPWILNKEVMWHTEQPFRSTSIGDVVTDGAGCVFRCVFAGWEKLSQWGKPVEDEKVYNIPCSGDMDSKEKEERMNALMSEGSVVIEESRQTRDRLLEAAKKLRAEMKKVVDLSSLMVNYAVSYQYLEELSDARDLLAETEWIDKE